MKVATRDFAATSTDGERIDVTRGEHVADTHDLVREYPEFFEDLRLSQVRSAARAGHTEPGAPAHPSRRDRHDHGDSLPRPGSSTGRGGPGTEQPPALKATRRRVTGLHRS